MMMQSSNARDLNPLWEPAIVLPAQLDGRRGPQSPEASLMSAVLEDAFLCIQKNVGARDRRRLRALNDAYGWFSSDSRAWPFAFVPMCEMLGLDVAAVRERVSALMTRHSAATAPPSASWQTPAAVERFIGRSIGYSANRPPSARIPISAEAPASAAGSS